MFRTLSILIVSLALMAPVANADNVSSDDTKFIKEAANGGMLEVELGKIALAKASSSKVHRSMCGG